MLGVDKDMDAKQEYQDAIARAYANRLRIENEAIRAKQNAQEEMDNLMNGILIVMIVIVCILLIWLYLL